MIASSNRASLFINEEIQTLFYQVNCFSNRAFTIISCFAFFVFELLNYIPGFVHDSQQKEKEKNNSRSNGKERALLKSIERVIKDVVRISDTSLE